MRISRKKFVKDMSLASISLGIMGMRTEKNNAKEIDKITILHTNDVHSRLEPFPLDGSRNAGLGGVAARSAIIQQIRNEVEHVLLLDAGDIFQGTPYFNIHKGEPDIKAMTMMGYDACTIGNHDFDGGIDNYATQISKASFPAIICNYDFSNTTMKNKSVPYKIFNKGNLQIGVLGVGIELKGLVPDNFYGNTVYRNPIECANTTASILNDKGCDLIICLSHLGDKYDDGRVSDEILAQECYDIDLIIGGHTHRFFNAPRVYKNKRGNETWVNQAGWGGLQLGRLDYSFVRSRKKKSLQPHTVVIGKKTNE
jgi:5'-nucleotidase